MVNSEPNQIKEETKKEESLKVKAENKSSKDNTTQWNITKDALRPNKYISPRAPGSQIMLGTGKPKSRLLKAAWNKNATESGNSSGRKVLVLRYTPGVLSFVAHGPTLSQAAHNGAMASVASSPPLSSAPNSSAPINASMKAAPAHRQTHKMAKQIFVGLPCRNCEKPVDIPYLGLTGYKPLCEACHDLWTADGEPLVWGDMNPQSMPEATSDTDASIKARRRATQAEQSGNPVAADDHGTSAFARPEPKRHRMSSKQTATLQKSPLPFRPTDEQARDAVDHVVPSVAGSMAHLPKKRSHEETELVSDTRPRKLFKIAGMGSEQVRDELDTPVQTDPVNGTAEERFVAEDAQEDDVVKNAKVGNTQDNTEEEIPEDQAGQAELVIEEGAEEGDENDSSGSSDESSDNGSEQDAQDYKIAYHSVTTLCRRLFELERLEKEHNENVLRSEEAYENSLNLTTANKDIMSRTGVEIAELTRQANIARVDLIAKRPERQSEYRAVLCKAEQAEESLREKTEVFLERGRAESYADGEMTPLDRKKRYKKDLEDTKRELEEVRAEVKRMAVGDA